MTSLKRTICILTLLLTFVGCSSNKSIQFEGEELETSAYDGTLARVSIYGINDGYDSADGDVLAELQAVAKEKLQGNRSLFSGSRDKLYILKIKASPSESGVECINTKFSHTTEGTLDTHFTLATLERTPHTLFDVEIETNGRHEVSTFSDAKHLINCGTVTAIATDAISRSIRIFDLLIKEANGLDVTRELETVKNDEDINGSTIVMKAVGKTLYGVLAPVAIVINSAAEADWSSAISSAAKAADNMPTASYDPLTAPHTTPAYTVNSPVPQRPQSTQTTSPQNQPSSSSTQSRPKTPAATKTTPTRAPRKTATAEIQARGTTDMHFPYDQALNLATTNADTQARQSCRENYRGNISTLGDPNMEKKECVENRNQEYRCVVQIVHTCEYKQ
ncbi:hypothetical protein MARI_31420 [Marinobacter sp. JH2]|nr:hypothetical protein [Marinobacter sp. JH2]QBM18999.1 hypothetical protein MARI_31420 [Marinobacter sp. JH2]